MELIHDLDTLCFMPLPASFLIEVTAEDEKNAAMEDGPVCRRILSRFGIERVGRASCEYLLSIPYTTQYCPIAHAVSRALDLPVGLVEAGDRGIELWSRMTRVFIKYLPDSELHNKYVEWWDTGQTKFARPTPNINYTFRGGRYVQ